MPKLRRGHKNDLGSLFAASIVTAFGAAVCAILFMIGDPEGSPWVIALIAGIAFVLLATILGVRIPRSGSSLGFWYAFFGTRAGRDQPVDYEPRPVRTQYGQSVGNQRPITAEEVRDIRELSTTTWVPSRLSSRSKESGDRLN